MAPQAKEESGTYADLLILRCGFMIPCCGFVIRCCRFKILHQEHWKVSHADGGENSQIVIAVEIMVKSKNLFRLKDGLGPYLVDANTILHLPLHLQKIPPFI
jgi:hypothetical protein